MKNALTTCVLCLCSAVLAGDVLLNGDMEKADIMPIRPRALWVDKATGNWTVVSNDSFRAEQVMHHAKTGRGALQLDCTDANVLSEINVYDYALPVQPNTPYEFSVDYLVETGDAETSVSSRVTVFDKNQKPLKYFWDSGYAHRGSWRELRRAFTTPEQAATVGLTIHIKGKHRTYLDNLMFRKRVVKAVRKVKPSPSAVLLDVNNQLELWGDILDRRQESTGAPGVNRTLGKIRLSAVRGERESFQLNVVAKTSLAALEPRFSLLRGEGGKTLPATALSARTIRFITMEKPENPDLQAPVADPLSPLAPQAATPERNALFAISIDVPRDAAPGLYQGAVELVQAGKKVASAPVELRVRKVTLPEQAKLKTLFYASSRVAKNQYGDSRSQAAIADDLGHILKAHRINGDQAELPPVPAWKLEGENLVITDWSRFDRFVEHAARTYGMRTFMVPKIFMLGDSSSGWFEHVRRAHAFGASALSPTGIERMAQFARLFTEHVKVRFPDYEFFCYLYEEPHHAVWPKINEIGRALKQAAPDFKIFYVTVFPDALKPMDVWCNSFDPNFCTPANIRKALSQGQRIWYYNYPVSIERGSYIHNRLFPWQVYANHGEGALLWQINNTPEGVNPWTQLDRTHNLGQATLIYPALTPGGKFHSSLRFELIREGIDDYDYLKLLEEAIDRRFTGLGRQRVMEMITELLNDLPFGYRNDPDVLRQVRDKIGQELERYENGCQALITSKPTDNSQTVLPQVDVCIYAPAGTSVMVNGSNLGTVQGKKLPHQLVLSKMGNNRITFELRKGARTERFERNYTLTPDPVLKGLKKLAQELKAAGMSAGELEAFLQQAGIRYDQQARLQAQQLTARYQSRLLGSKLAKVQRSGAGARAHWAYEHQLFERAGYYLELNRKLTQAMALNRPGLRVKPVLLKGFFGLELSNGKLQAVVLENGGRIVSLAYKGEECFNRGQLSSPLTEVERARMPKKLTVQPLSKLGGYGDAFSFFPEGAYDWDISAVRHRGDKLEVTTTCRFNQRNFILERTVTLAQDSTELVLDYRLVNTLPDTFVSDDPKAYWLEWRGAVCPALGGSAEGDQLWQEGKTVTFSARQPRYFERNFKFDGKSNLTARDAGRSYRLELVGDKNLPYGYVWFNSDPAQFGGLCRYNLELVRHTYGNGGEIQNKPFNLLPGTSQVFRCRIRICEQ